MFRLHCTKKLLDRIKPEIVVPAQSNATLGNWYAINAILERDRRDDDPRESICQRKRPGAGRPQ